MRSWLGGGAGGGVCGLAYTIDFIQIILILLRFSSILVFLVYKSIFGSVRLKRP